MMTSGRIAALALGAVLTATPWGTNAAQAQNIAEPEVTKGQSKLEVFSQWQGGLHGGAAGDTRDLYAPNFSYGLTEFWQIKAILALERPVGDDLRATSATVENTFEFVNAKRGGIGLAWFTSITGAIDDNETNAVLFGPIVRIGGGPLSLILNPFLEKTFGANREPGIHFTYGWQLKQEVSKGWWIGVEGFGRTPDFDGDAGAHEHRVGPVVTHEIEIGGKRTFTIEAGVQFGLNNTTPEVAPKLQLTLQY
jgi:hypothetical protein